MSMLLLGFFVWGLFAAEFAILVHFQSIRIILLVLVGLIVPLLAFRAGHGHRVAHLFTPHLPMVSKILLI
jgi:hypothetical protein